MASSAAAMVSVPLGMFSVCSALMASLTAALMVSVSSSMVSEASPASSVAPPDLMPFLPFALMRKLPAPQSVTVEPSLHLMTAFSASVFSGYSPSLFCALSVRTFSVPSAARIATPDDLPQVMGAVALLVRSRPFKIRVTPVVPFLILIEPSAHAPETV